MLTAVCRFHSYVFEFRKYGSCIFTDTWRNQLDPYRITDIHDTEAIAVLQNASELCLDDAWTQVDMFGEGFFRTVVYLNKKGETLWEYTRYAKKEVYLRLWMAKDYSQICLVADNSNTGGNLPYICLGYLVPFVLLNRNAITFHGVLLEHERRGIIISAPSGFGKTTHARLWRDHKRALILNGDKSTCCMENGRWIGFSLPWAGSSGEHINRDVPVTAFVALERAEENAVERLDEDDAFRAVMSGVHIPAWDKELAEKAVDLIIAFIEKVPVFRLCCRPDTEAVEVLDRALRDT